ncbi:MAG TPA: TonB-dependent receptor [Gemmatimonadaceae bacterium]|nr:TonB-dependent receptor [Gemmatimonadaceae bacterium]
MRLPRMLLSGLALALGASATAQAQARLTGRVLDAATNAPLAGVSVGDAGSAASAVTDPQGRFSLPCRGAMTLVVSKLGYLTAQRAVDGCAADVQVMLAPGAQSLGAVNVVGTAEERTVEQAQAVTVLSAHELERGTGLFLQDAINLTPGIRMERRTMSGGQTVTIRGYRNDSDAGNFVGTGYKAYYNGIPITNAEGLTILDDVDFATLGRVDVVRGPASSLYGGGIGGVVSFYTALPSQLGTTVVQEATVGEDGLLRSDTRLEHLSGGAATVLDYGHQGYDSYRIHSASKKDYATFLGEFTPSERRTISTFLSYAASRDQRAGELDSAQFAQELNTGEERYLDNDARQEIESVRAGVTHRYRLNDHVQNVATAFYSGNTLEDVFAVALNSKANQNFGARVAFDTDFPALPLPLHGTTGAEFQKSNVSAQGYAMSDGVLGAMRSDLETHTMQYSLFTQWDVALPSDVTLTLGASGNFLEYAIDDRMATSANPTHLDGSGRKTFDPVITPRVAVRKMFGPNVSAYASVSQGYQPPTAADAVIPFTGEPNEALEPERATQYEIGSKGSLLGNRFTYEVALFDLRVTDKLTSQAVFDTDGTRLYSYTVNSGDQVDRGLEVAASYAVIDDPTRLLSLLRPFVSYTYSDFTYRDFQSDANDDAGTVDYSGNDVVGVAPHVFNAGVDAALRSGLYLNATFHHTDDLPISYDNAHVAPGFSLLNAKLGFAHELTNRFTLDAFVGGMNLTGSRYYTQVFLNHRFETPNPHMYLNGPYTAKYYGGLKVSYRP